MKKAAELLEQLLLLRCQMGDNDALAELIERYERPLRYFINRLLDDSELTEDIFQDTWLTVINRIHGLREVDAFPAWLYRIARNKVYQQLRKKRYVSKLDESIAVEDNAREEDFSAEDAAKVHKSLKELPPEYREYVEESAFDTATLIRMTNALYDISALESGATKPSLERQDMRCIVERAIRSLGPMQKPWRCVFCTPTVSLRTKGKLRNSFGAPCPTFSFRHPPW